MKLKGEERLVINKRFRVRAWGEDPVIMAWKHPGSSGTRLGHSVWLSYFPVAIMKLWQSSLWDKGLLLAHSSRGVEPMEAGRAWWQGPGWSITHFSSRKPDGGVGVKLKVSTLFHYLPKLWLRKASQKKGVWKFLLCQ